MINLYHTLKSIDQYKKVVINDLLCVEYKCYDERDQFNFWTDCSCLVYCTSGKKIYGSLGHDFEVKPGTIFFLKKGAYTGRNIHGEQYCALMFFMPDSFFRDFLVRYPQFKSTPREPSNSNIIDIAQDQLLESYFGSVMQYFTSTISKEVLSLKMDELAINLFTNPMHRKVAEYISSLVDNRTASLRYVIEQNFASNIKLEEMASLCSMSLSSFKREFKRVYKESPGKWLLHRKLKYSKNLLLSTDHSINEVAFRSGFEDTSHFIRVFKRVFSTTPSRFREEQKPT